MCLLGLSHSPCPCQQLKPELSCYVKPAVSTKNDLCPPQKCWEISHHWNEVSNSKCSTGNRHHQGHHHHQADKKLDGLTSNTKENETMQ